MHASSLPKHLKRLPREHVSLGHEEELRRALLPLADDFDRWRKGELGSGELSGLIHEFHDGRAREIWKTYHHGDLEMAVAYAIHAGILRREDVPAQLLEGLARQLFFYANQGEDELQERRAEP